MSPTFAQLQEQFCAGMLFDADYIECETCLQYCWLPVIKKYLCLHNTLPVNKFTFLLKHNLFNNSVSLEGGVSIAEGSAWALSCEGDTTASSGADWCGGGEMSITGGGGGTVWVFFSLTWTTRLSCINRL